MKKATKKPAAKPSWRTLLRQAEKAKTETQATMLRNMALKQRRSERSETNSEARQERSLTGPESIPNTEGFAKSVSWERSADDGSHPMTYSTGSGGVGAAPDSDVANGITTHAHLTQAIMEASRKKGGEAVVGELLASHYSDIEHNLKVMFDRSMAASGRANQEAFTINMVRSYMALVDGVSATRGETPASIVVPWLIALHVYDALQKAGFRPS